jgi:hypothetical protein
MNVECSSSTKVRFPSHLDPNSLQDSFGILPHCRNFCEFCTLRDKQEKPRPRMTVLNSNQYELEGLNLIRYSVDVRDQK